MIKSGYKLTGSMRGTFFVNVPLMLPVLSFIVFMILMLTAPMVPDDRTMAFMPPAFLARFRSESGRGR